MILQFAAHDLRRWNTEETQSSAMGISLKSFLLVLLLVEASGSICPEKCNCTYFGVRKLTKVKCRGIEQVPCDKIPSTTVKL